MVVAESGLKVELLNQSMGDLAALADMKATKEDIANAFHVPLAFLTTQTNLANLQAAEHQHMSKAIGPRLQRRDEKLNDQLVPLFDPTGRLFLASDDPTPENLERTMQQMELDLKYGVLTINEVRGSDAATCRCRGATSPGCRCNGPAPTSRAGGGRDATHRQEPKK